MAKTAPDTPSSDYEAMRPYWTMVEALMGGTSAMRAAGNAYLPKFHNETQPDYDDRLANSKFTNIYADIVGTLASKPFAEKLTVADSASDVVRALGEDIDGRGANLHVFAQRVFAAGLNNAIDWVLVDYTRAIGRSDGRPLSVAEERGQGLRPYWVRIPATRMLAVYSDVVKGVEAFVHARILETATRRDGFDEVAVERVRVLNRDPIYAVTDQGNVTDQIIDYAPATFEVWEKRAASGRIKSNWTLVDQGPITIGVIALSPFLTGERIGSSWRVRPPMEGAAYMQVEHYQDETRLKQAKEFVGSPMLSGNGVIPPMDKDNQPVPVPVSPKTTLYAPPIGDNGQHGSWEYLRVDAAGLKFLSDDIDRLEKQMRELGRQPLIASTGITVVAAAYASQKASSVLKSWAQGLKDALEQALRYTAMWLNDPTAEPTISWSLDDLDLDMQDDDGMSDLQAARANGDLSQTTLWAELKRRGKLSPDFDADEERDRLVEEMPGDDDEDDERGALGGRPVQKAA